VTRAPSRHSTTILVGEARIVLEKSTAAGRRTARFVKTVISKPLIRSGPERYTPTRIWFGPRTFPAGIAWVSVAVGAGPFSAVPAGAQGADVLNEAGSLKQTVPAAWAGGTTDGIPRKTPSRSNGRRDNNSFLFNTFVHL